MNASVLVKLLAYGVPVIFVLAGFLLGLWKGGKKAGLRFVVFCCFAAFTFLFSQMIAKAVVNINITVDGESLSISQLIENYILEIDKVAYFYSVSDSFAQVVHNIPVAVVNLVVFVVLLYVFAFVGWIVYLILSAIFLKERKKPYIIKNGKAQVVDDYPKQKKHRLLGAFIGVLQALILVFLTFMPITAGATTIAGYINSSDGNVAYAMESEVEYTPTSKMLRESLPQEAIDLINEYTSTLTSKMYSAVDLDKVCFDILTTVKVGDETIVLRKELNNFANIYDSVEFLTNFKVGRDKFKDINFDLLETAINKVFESGFFKTLLPDTVEFIVEDLVSENPQLGINLPEGYLRYLQVINDEIQDGAKNDSINFYKTEIYSVFGVIKSFAQSGIADELVNEKIDIDKIISLINANNRVFVSNLTNNLFESKFAKSMFVEYLNVLLEKADTIDNEISVPSIDKSLVNWSKVKVELTDTLNQFLDIYENFNQNVDGNISQLMSNPELVLNLDIDRFTLNLTNIMNNIQSSALLVTSNNASIYNSLIDLFETTNYSKYVDLTVFKQQNKWNEELGYLKTALNAIKDSGISTSLFGDNLDAKIVIDNLAKKDIDTNKTYIRQVLEPLLESKAFARIVSNVGFAYVDSFIESNQNKLGENVTLGQIQVESLKQENEKQLVVAFFENIVVYAQELDFEKLNSDAFSAIISSNLASLGNALDTIKSSSLFGPYQEKDVVNKGIYENLIEALANNQNLNTFIDIQAALNDDFTWNEELSLLQDAVTILNKIKVEYGQDEKSVIEALRDGEDLSLIFEYLSTENDDIDTIVSALSQSKVMKKTLLLIVDAMNEKLTQILNLKNPIPSVSQESDLYSQREIIVQTIKDTVDVYASFKNGIDIEKLDANYQKIGKLLNTLMISKLNNGIFVGTYDGFIDYLNSTEYVEKISFILSEYKNQTDVDWIQILELSIESKKYDGTIVDQELANKISQFIANVYDDEDCGSITTSLIEISNMFYSLKSEADKMTVLNTTISAFQKMEAYNNQKQKVDKVCQFISKVAGVTEINDLAAIDDYSQTKKSLDSIKQKMDLVQQNNADIVDIKNIIDILAGDKDLTNVLTKNNFEISIDAVLKSDVESYIGETVSDLTLSAQLKNIFQID